MILLILVLLIDTRIILVLVQIDSLVVVHILLMLLVRIRQYFINHDTPETLHGCNLHLASLATRKHWNFALIYGFFTIFQGKKKI